MRESDVRTKVFEADAGRPGIVIETENGQVKIHLLTGKSGNSDVSPEELKELAQITAAAVQYLEPPETRLG